MAFALPSARLVAAATAWSQLPPSSSSRIALVRLVYAAHCASQSGSGAICCSASSPAESCQDFSNAAPDPREISVRLSLALASNAATRASDSARTSA